MRKTTVNGGKINRDLATLTDGQAPDITSETGNGTVSTNDIVKNSNNSVKHQNNEINLLKTNSANPDPESGAPESPTGFYGEMISQPENHVKPKN